MHLGAQIQKHLVENRLYDSIDAMNIDTGVAPSFQDVFEKYTELRQDMKMPPVNYAVYRDRKNGFRDVCRNGMQHGEPCALTKRKTQEL